MDTFRLTNYFNRKNIAANITANNKKVVFDHLTQLLSQDNQALQNTIHECLIKRERLGSTAIGHHIAIPHASIEGLEQPIIALLTLQKDIDFDEPHQENVSTVLGLLTPPAKSEPHIDLMSTLSKLLSKKNVLENLRKAESTDDLYNRFVMACTTE